ncbi:outer membrane lipid asymmetry maintenance protein MlaD [Nitrococcus mobilis]|uniref:ABC-type transport system involved in resistance to organic solvents periplasmic component n=1 Tax=Nitrococcus mobilis Nb-231 TaxID=314278 RepID=A4BQL3_9GAMM|nr:outer membrane lipid asymmetry maintenance protein MlaD [Nitrococcus mobilis]EAR21863.1 ABC-type transport system involved in resistance to organic solvents periplasmic component [Nitrococcus mobilis Nb-231]
MQNSRLLEIGVGLFVLLGLGALLTLALKVSNISAFQQTQGYDVIAQFQNIGGLKVRAPVTLAGVPVGRVESIAVDPKTFEARVVLTISDKYANLPQDTSASIFTAGLLGEQYIGLQPGGMEEVLKPGDELMLTQSAVVLEQLIGQFLYSTASGASESQTDGGQEP